MLSTEVPTLVLVIIEMKYIVIKENQIIATALLPFLCFSIPTGGGQIIPTYYYWHPPKFFTFRHHCIVVSIGRMTIFRHIPIGFIVRVNLIINCLKCNLFILCQLHHWVPINFIHRSFMFHVWNETFNIFMIALGGT